MDPAYLSIRRPSRDARLGRDLRGDRRRAHALTVAAILATGAACAASGLTAGAVASSTRTHAKPAITRAHAKPAITRAHAKPAITRAHAKPAITTAPVHVLATKRGDVAYRSVGIGRPLVLIMGLGSSMEDWAPSFVDRLALTHRVVIFDNAGIGRTAALPGQLTMSAMADQTSALIAALGLKRPDVLGWSMGGLVAQALAVRHPTRVHRLVLAATQPGTGKAKPIPAKVQQILATATAEQFNALLFPADQQAALQAYTDAIAGYTDRATVPDAVFGAQSHALHGWLAGSEAAGHKASASTIETLVADGRRDEFNPLANSRQLAHLFRRSQLQLYPDAGHAFLFQDYVKFANRVNAFLAAKP